MAAAPASRLERSECLGCGKPVEGELAPHVCGSCGRPQPVGKREDYFSAFGLPRRFGIDLSALERSCLSFSRALHPDRFSAARGPEAAELLKCSHDRMSFVNRAYTTLKNPEDRRRYLLGLEGLVTDAKAAGSAMPLDLAEEWFELQDAASDDPAGAAARIAAFRDSLERALADEDRKARELEQAYDRAPSRAALESVARSVNTTNYLRSLRRDVDRLAAAGRGA